MVNKKIISIRIISIMFVAVSGYYVNTAISTKNNNATQIKSLKKSIENAEADKKENSKNNASQTDYSTKQKNTQESMSFASKFITNYLQALANASTSTDVKAINKTYLSSNTKLSTDIIGGDDHEPQVLGVFGKDIKDIAVTPSVPNEKGLISVFVSSSSKKTITFRATYDLNMKKIVKTETYTLTPKSGS